MATSSIGDALFTKTQQGVLGLLYGKPDHSFYTNEIVRCVAMGKGTVSRELERLVGAGLLASRREGNLRYYQANTQSPVYPELLGIVRKTFGIADVVKAALASVLEQIDIAFIYGSIAKGEATANSDVDLLVISETLDYADLMETLLVAEQSLGRTVNPSLYTKAQIRNKIDEGNAFITRLMDQSKVWVKGNDNAIGEIRQPCKSKEAKN